MTTLTLTIDDDLADSLTRLAQERRMPVDQLVATELNNSLERERSRRRLRELVETSPLQLEPGWKWNREDCYDRPMLRGYKRPPVRSDGPPE